MEQHERPTLQLIGKAEDVVLGIIVVGSDPDGTMFPDDLEFADEA